MKQLGRLLEVLLLVLIFSRTTVAQTIPRLELNQPVEREIAATEVHIYRLHLAADQFAHLGFSGKGFSLGVKVFAPDGGQLLELGKLEGAFGVKPISLASASAGDYRIEVRLLDGTPGRYQLLVDELRAAAPPDRHRALAEAAFLEAELLRRRGRKEDLQRAVEIIGVSLPNWSAAQRPIGEADALNLMGMIHRRLGQSSPAIERYQQAFGIFQRENLGIGQAVVLCNIGVVYSETGDKVTALRIYQQAAQQCREMNSPMCLGIPLTNLGSLYGSVGELRKGVEVLNEALEIWTRFDDQRWKAGTIERLATLHSDLGEPETAAEFCRQALELWRETDGPYQKAQALMCVGGAQGMLGNFAAAIEHQTEAVKLCRETGNSNCETTALSGLGLIYTTVNDYRRAIECFQQALVIAQASNNPYNQAKLSNNLGGSYLRLNDLTTAEPFLLQSLKLQQTVGDDQGEAAARGFLARLHSQQGRLLEALTSSQKALELIERQHRSLSGHSLQASYFGRQHSFHEFQLDLLMKLHRQSPAAGYAVAAFQTSERARARSLLESLADVRADIRQGIEPELLERETALRRQLSYKEQALTQLFSGKSTAEQIAAAKKELESLLAQQHELDALIRARSPHYAALTRPEPLSLKEIQAQALTGDTLLLEYAMGEERGYLFAVTRNSFQVYELARRVELEAAAKDLYQSLTADRARREFEADDDWQARLKQREREFAQKSAALSRMLLSPVAARLGKRRLLIVAEGVLQYVPFAALPVLGRPLIANHELVSLPSASVLAVSRRELSQRPPAAKSLAVLADPVFTQDDARLKPAQSGGAPPSCAAATNAEALRRQLRKAGRDNEDAASLARLCFTRQEAEAIAAFAPDDAKLLALDFNANHELAVSGRLGQYRIIHFATHGWLDSAVPDLSAVVLSLVDKNGQAQNGFLRLHEIYNLNLPAELVVLSACETGLGKDVRGEGLIGLTRGFLYAGARRVVVSLWPVNDPATAALMQKFYRGMLKENLRPAAALAKAQAEMSRDARWRSPYYWAGFVLQGEW